MEKAMESEIARDVRGVQRLVVGASGGEWLFHVKVIHVASRSEGEGYVVVDKGEVFSARVVIPGADFLLDAPPLPRPAASPKQ
jgi:hypothetical protein